MHENLIKKWKNLCEENSFPEINDIELKKAVETAIDGYHLRPIYTNKPSYWYFVREEFRDSKPYQIIQDFAKKFGQNIEKYPSMKERDTIDFYINDKLGFDNGLVFKIVDPIAKIIDDAIAERKLMTMEEEAGINENKRGIKENMGNSMNRIEQLVHTWKKHYSEIIDDDSKGDVWALAIWRGKGYLLDVYLVRAEDIQPAIDKVFSWIWENEPGERNNLIYDYNWVSERALEDYNLENDTNYTLNNIDDFVDTDEYNEFEENDIDEYYISNDDHTLFAFSENFEVHEVPEEILAKMGVNEKSSFGRFDEETDFEDDEGLKELERFEKSTEGNSSKNIWFEKEVPDNMYPENMEKVEGIPDYAADFLTYLDEYGKEEAMDNSDLEDEDIENIFEFMNKNGYKRIVKVYDDSKVGFNRYPVFGLPCSTVTAVFEKGNNKEFSDDFEEEREDARIYFANVKENGEEIAFFVDNIREENGEEIIGSYMHLGQHGDASVDFLLNDTVPMKNPEQSDLYKELTEKVGYDIEIVKDFRKDKHIMHEKLIEKWVELCEAETAKEKHHLENASRKELISYIGEDVKRMKEKMEKCVRDVAYKFEHVSHKEMMKKYKKLREIIDDTTKKLVDEIKDMVD